MEWEGRGERGERESRDLGPTSSSHFPNSIALNSRLTWLLSDREWKGEGGERKRGEKNERDREEEGDRYREIEERRKRESDIER